ncbi:MAG TPA: hypothetical protein VIF15_05085 [Polyangiaceae bacterium]
MTRAALAGLLGAASVLGLGCGPALTVERAYDGTVVEGRFVDPEAYASFLRGAIAEAGGHPVDALAAYGEAARRDPSGPEPWARIGDVRCRADPRDRHADEALDHALELDPGYAPGWAMKARCALSRGDTPGARAAAARAASLDPGADGANVLLARTGSGVPREATRDVLVALTVTARDPVVAWDALASWGEAHGDVALWARALRELVRLVPARRETIARAAEELAGAGNIAEAWGVAAAAVDADARPLAGGHPLAARLAVDEALSRCDAVALRRRATRARLPLEEAAARALLAGQPALARELATEVVRADPGARGARLVLAASGPGGDVLGAVGDAREEDAPSSAAALVVFGVALAHATAPAQARATLAALAHEAIVDGDDRVTRPAVELVSRGVLGPDVLPADGAVELAALRGEAPAEGAPSPDPLRLDLRHEYLALSLSHPDAPRVRALAQTLGRNGAADPVVAAAAALVQLAVGAPIPPEMPRALLARNAADPLLAATALRLAERVGDPDVARRAREALMTLGRATPPRPAL